MISLAIESQSRLKILQIQMNKSRILMIQKIKMSQKIPQSHQLWRISKENNHKRFPRLTTHHSEDVILGNKDDPIGTRAFLRNNENSSFGLVSMIEPTLVDKALQDTDWIISRQEELNQFT